MPTGIAEPEVAGRDQAMPKTSRRRHTRVLSLGRCFAQLGDGWEGSILNLSQGGMLVRLKRVLTPGSSYFVKLFLDERIAVVEARVVRLSELEEECLAGMEFLNVPLDDLAYLRGYMRR